MENNYFVYVLLCRDGSFYCGYTNNVLRRFNQHRKGLGAKYTRSHPPILILNYWQYHTKKMALKKEYEFKQLNRKQKINKMCQSGINVNLILKRYGFK